MDRCITQMHLKVNKSFHLTGFAIKMVTCWVRRSESKVGLLSLSLSLRSLTLFATHTQPGKKEWERGKETRVHTKKGHRNRSFNSGTPKESKL